MEDFEKIERDKHLEKWVSEKDLEKYILSLLKSPQPLTQIGGGAKTVFSKEPQGFKEFDDKLPLYKVLFVQFPKAMQKLAERSALGHEKYRDFDEDWQNFRRVPCAIEHYKDALMRHAKDGEWGAVLWNAAAIAELGDN
jgi:hypothetical protein